jgi:D-sedoheptulose 7-phosphate isomerase
VLYKAFDELNIIFESMRTQGFEEHVTTVVELVCKAFRSEKKILLVGNGGSAAEAQHMAAEYTATLNMKNFRKGYPALALTTDTSFLTAWSNDFGFRDIFARQVETLGSNGDILFAYSTSGNSENVIRAIIEAKRKSLYIIGFSGNNGGQIADMCDICFVVPSKSTARIQEVHTLLGHTICAQMENTLEDIGNE